MLPWFDDAHQPADEGEPSLSKRVRHDMLGLILAGQLAPGQKINEPDVAARLGISRVPVREALRELESSGLVVARKNAGTFVRRLDLAEIGHLYELRALLDGHAGRHAASLPATRRRALAAALTEAIREMREAAEAESLQRYHVGNLRFHWALIEAADNPVFADTCRGVIRQLHVARMTNLSSAPAMRQSIAEHTQIARAVRAGDAELACGLQTRHAADAWLRLSAGAAAPSSLP